MIKLSLQIPSLFPENTSMPAVRVHRHAATSAHFPIASPETQLSLQRDSKQAATSPRGAQKETLSFPPGTTERVGRRILPVRTRPQVALHPGPGPGRSAGLSGANQGRRPQFTAPEGPWGGEGKRQLTKSGIPGSPPQAGTTAGEAQPGCHHGTNRQKATPRRGGCGRAQPGQRSQGVFPDVLVLPLGKTYPEKISCK